MPHFQKLYSGDSALFLKGRNQVSNAHVLHIAGPTLYLVPIVPPLRFVPEVWLFFPSDFSDIGQRGTVGWRHFTAAPLEAPPLSEMTGSKWAKAGVEQGPNSVSCSPKKPRNCWWVNKWRRRIFLFWMFIWMHIIISLPSAL